MRVCKNETCTDEFKPNKHNQIYCDDLCRKEATNKRLMKRYYELASQRATRLSHPARCACGNKISRYNESVSCYRCLESGAIDNEQLLERLVAN